MAYPLPDRRADPYRGRTRCIPPFGHLRHMIPIAVDGDLHSPPTHWSYAALGPLTAEDLVGTGRQGAGSSRKEVWTAIKACPLTVMRLGTMALTHHDHIRSRSRSRLSRRRSPNPYQERPYSECQCWHADHSLWMARVKRVSGTTGSGLLARSGPGACYIAARSRLWRAVSWASKVVRLGIRFGRRGQLLRCGWRR